MECLASRPNPRLEDHPLSHVRYWLFHIFTSTLHTWRPFLLHPQSADSLRTAWMRWRAFGFHKMLWSSWLALNPIASLKGHCFMYLVGCLTATLQAKSHGMNLWSYNSCFVSFVIQGRTEYRVYRQSLSLCVRGYVCYPRNSTPFQPVHKTSASTW